MRRSRTHDAQWPHGFIVQHNGKRVNAIFRTLEAAETDAAMRCEAGSRYTTTTVNLKLDQQHYDLGPQVSVYMKLPSGCSKVTGKQMGRERHAQECLTCFNVSKARERRGKVALLLHTCALCAAQCCEHYASALRDPQGASSASEGGLGRVKCRSCQNRPLRGVDGTITQSETGVSVGALTTVRRGDDA